MLRRPFLFGLFVLLGQNASLLAQDAVKPINLADFDARIKPGDRLHWSFQPVKKPAVPQVKNQAWTVNPIDAFVLHILEENGWQPAAAAEPRSWLRRVYLDVIGMPPTIAEQQAFLSDPSPQARDKTVNELLSRSAYGERWARHWLDVVRYAETNGYERDAARPHVWRFRDYVIRAFNDDKPFDRFILEQLAGDELDDANADSMIALGFNRLGPWDDEPADPKEDRFDQLDDIVSTTSLTFLGLTIGCARCHDHKFDSITMHDYYRMVAVFNPLVRPRNGRTELDLPTGTRAELERQNERDRQIANLMKEAPKDKVSAEIMAKIAELRAQSPDLPRGYFLHEPAQPPATHLLIRGKAARPGPQVEPGMPTVLVDAQPTFPPGKNTSLRRLTLARWLAQPGNPLTARVIVNRIWHYHFGAGLVRTPNDFGILGQPPTHPELLDWLAARFIEEGWSIKKLHHLILTSNTYGMSREWHKEYAAKDPEGELLWRFPGRRLEVEAIRDSMLVVSGQLNPNMYGPSMYPEVPKEALAGSSDPDKIWKPFDEREASRRTVYAFLKRSFIVPMLEVLDLCDTTRSAEKRLTTTVAPQALTLFNGAFVNRQAGHFANRLRQEAGTDVERQIELAYQLALCRPPTDSERTALREFLTRQSLEQMCRVIFNLNEFVYPE